MLIISTQPFADSQPFAPRHSSSWSMWNLWDLGFPCWLGGIHLVPSQNGRCSTGVLRLCLRLYLQVRGGFVCFEGNMQKQVVFHGISRYCIDGSNFKRSLSKEVLRIISWRTLKDVGFLTPGSIWIHAIPFPALILSGCQNRRWKNLAPAQFIDFC